MEISLFTSTGTRKGTLELPTELFGAPINHSLMHQAVVLQQSNRRNPVAHARNRSEVAGSTRKLYAQKGTGRARRGSIRSPLLRGGGKAFGPRKDANFIKQMPKSMRRAALLSCLSFRAKQGAILGLENYPDTIKTKDVASLLRKMPLEYGRRVLFVHPGIQKSLVLSARNIPGVETLAVSYLNPEDILAARHIIFLADAIATAKEMWGMRKERTQKTPRTEKMEKDEEEKPTVTKKKTTIRKTSPRLRKKAVSSSSSGSSESSESSGSSGSSASSSSSDSSAS
ncbi:MAG: LSU ribosomal protein L4P [Candidatus Peregrinibacteria bacterium Greene0416_19]|nr:MAG: LSU ribosomal protein L4P [Candidatus Peregrinibacteria bacterium Greene0416_19]